MERFHLCDKCLNAGFRFMPAATNDEDTKLVALPDPEETAAEVANAVWKAIVPEFIKLDDDTDDPLAGAINEAVNSILDPKPEPKPDDG